MSGGNVSIVDGLSNMAAGVDSIGRLKTRSTTYTSSLDASIAGDHYDVSAPAFPSFTNAAETPLVYLKNDEKEQISWAITSVSVTAAASIGGNINSWSIRFLLNPKAGTIISGGTDGVVTQMNIGKTVALQSVCKIGATGQTLTGESASILKLLPSTPNEVNIPDDAVIIPSGGSIGMMVTPPTGNIGLSLDFRFSLIRLTGN